LTGFGSCANVGFEKINNPKRHKLKNLNEIFMT